jgi:hypothetical protein
MENINVKIPKGTVVKIEGFLFQLTTSLELKVSDKILKVEGHTLLNEQSLNAYDRCNAKIHRS